MFLHLKGCVCVSMRYFTQSYEFAINLALVWLFIIWIAFLSFVAEQKGVREKKKLEDGLTMNEKYHD